MWTKLLQLGGWVILIAYLAQAQSSFAPVWVLAYVVISIAVAGGYVLLVKPMFSRASAPSENEIPPRQGALHIYLPHEKNASLFEELHRRPIPFVLLAPGETGFFFVPVAIVGVSWWSALVAALLFGVAHYKTYSAEQCGVKAITALINCFFILPYGVIHLAVGQFAVDALAVGAFLLSERKERAIAEPISDKPGTSEYVVVDTADGKFDIRPADHDAG